MSNESSELPKPLNIDFEIGPFKFEVGLLSVKIVQNSSTIRFLIDGKQVATVEYWPVFVSLIRSESIVQQSIETATRVYAAVAQRHVTARIVRDVDLNAIKRTMDTDESSDFLVVFSCCLSVMAMVKSGIVPPDEGALKQFLPEPALARWVSE